MQIVPLFDLNAAILGWLLAAVQPKKQLPRHKAEGLSCSLNGFYGGLGISKLQFLIKKHFFKYLLIEILDPEPGPH
jgi:hypothetical protein